MQNSLEFTLCDYIFSHYTFCDGILPVHTVIPLIYLYGIAMRYHWIMLPYPVVRLRLHTPSYIYCTFTHTWLPPCCGCAYPVPLIHYCSILPLTTFIDVPSSVTYYLCLTFVLPFFCRIADYLQVIHTNILTVWFTINICHGYHTYIYD